MGLQGKEARKFLGVVGPRRWVLEEAWGMVVGFGTVLYWIEYPTVIVSITQRSDGGGHWRTMCAGRKSNGP